MRDIYTAMFKYHRILPDEVGRQNPWVMMRLLDSLGDDAEDITEEITDSHLRMFYGKEV